MLPPLEIDPETFWAGFAEMLAELAPENARLLEIREDLQRRIDHWHRERTGQPHDPVAYQAFLAEIGYLLPESEDFQVATEQVDPEVARIAGPQLVVPITNARYALNAANARWGSLYDALYGNDVIAETGGAERGPGYNPARGARVIAYAREFLDASAPLVRGSHADATAYRQDGAVGVDGRGQHRSAGSHAVCGFPGFSREPESGIVEKQWVAYRNSI